jgi:hypothetical protein
MKSMLNPTVPENGMCLPLELLSVFGFFSQLQHRHCRERFPHSEEPCSSLQKRRAENITPTKRHAANIKDQMRIENRPFFISVVNIFVRDTVLIYRFFKEKINSSSHKIRKQSR